MIFRAYKSLKKNQKEKNIKADDRKNTWLD